MDVRAVLKSQYHAALLTLKSAMEKCPEGMWADAKDESAAFWRVAYHTMFFADYYSGQESKGFVPWAKDQSEAHMIGGVPWDNFRAPKACVPYTREELMGYWREVDGKIDGKVDALDLEREQCGFSWYKMGTLEHQVVNIRHVQHHAAILSSRLRREAQIGVDWVGKG